MSKILDKIYSWPLRKGITRTREFEKKHLAEYAVNIGLKCGHSCTYCSTGAMLRCHSVFKKLHLSPFDNSYAIVDPDIPDKVANDAHNKRLRGLIQICTIADAWAQEAQKYQLGRRCLEAILPQTGWSVRILTKNAAVRNDFDVIEKYKDRVLVGLSITATPEKSDVISTVEPNASTIEERIKVMAEANNRGFRTYAMICPVLPGIADSPEQIHNLVKLAVEFNAEEIFSEAVNPRGRGLILTQQALQSKGYHLEAAHIESIRCKENWSSYVVRLIKNMQQSVRKHYDIQKLRFLLYPGRLEKHDLNQIQQDSAGVVWL